jgi:hypothetical protein
MPAGQDPVTFGKIATQIMDGKKLGEIEEVNNWNPKDQTELPF